MISKLIKKVYSNFSNIKLPIDTNGVEVLDSIDFQNSLREVKNYTLLDTDRLANLWSYCKLSNKDGAILEIGSYKGGGALHLSNSQPDREIFIFDSFKGFQNIDSELDKNFNLTQFKDTAISKVNSLFSKKKRKYHIVDGFFPESVSEINLPNVSFVHLDVDIYEATLSSLLFLDKKMMNHSYIVIDDYKRNCKGIDKAISEFLLSSDNWRVFPLFPSQALLIHKSWFNNEN